MARKVEPRPARKRASPPAAPEKARAKGRSAASRTAAKKPAPARASPARKPAVPSKRRAVRPAETTPQEDALAVEAQNRRYYDAFQGLAADRMAQLWWHDDDASCIHPGWDLRRGFDAVMETYGEIFAHMKSIRFALGDVQVRVLGDLAYVTCVENLVSEEEEAGDSLGAVLATNLFERRKGEWRLVHHHASPFAADESEMPEGPLH